MAMKCLLDYNFVKTIKFIFFLKIITAVKHMLSSIISKRVRMY